MRRHSVARPGTVSRLPRQFFPISASHSEEKNTRSPTLDCSRRTSSVFELVTFCTAIVIAGRLSACPIAKRGSNSVPAAAAPRPTIERREGRIMDFSFSDKASVYSAHETQRFEMRCACADVGLVLHLNDQARTG